MKKYLLFSLSLLNVASSLVMPPVAHAIVAPQPQIKSVKLSLAVAAAEMGANNPILLGVSKTTSNKAFAPENASVDILIPLKMKKAWITAYSSSPDETDDTPFVTASGKPVRDGVVAANFLPLGCKIKIPSLFGDKIFVVEDRMHPRKTNGVDIWMGSKGQALRFGVSYADIVILN